MALPKINWEGIWESIVAHKKIVLIVLLGLLLILLFFFLSDRIGDAWFNSGVKKQKEAIANKVDQIAEKKKEIEADKAEMDRLTGEVKQETEQLTKDLEVNERNREITNQAIANFEAAKNAPPSNVDRTAEDLKAILDRLEKMQR